MSRLAKKTISMPPGVTVSQKKENILLFKGPKGEKELVIPDGVQVQIGEGRIGVTASSKEAGSNVQTGTTWALVRNCIEGVSTGFSKTLDIEGVGFKAALDGKDLVLSLGYTNPVRFNIAEGVKIEVEKNITIKIFGNDKDLVGATAANIRALKKPEPYKGKGIRYRGEVVRRKVGKKAGATAGASA